TPYYISPEAIERPDTITPVSDIYAVGAVGYFLLTGTPVFTGKTVLEICMKHVRVAPDPPSQRSVNPIATGVETVILRCPAKVPADRPVSAQGLLDELEHCKPAQAWTRTDAELWWAGFNRPGKADPSAAATVANIATPGEAGVKLGAGNHDLSRLA